MSKIKNNSQIVNKEVFKINLEGLKEIENKRTLTFKACKALMSLEFLAKDEAITKKLGFSTKKKIRLSFKQFIKSGRFIKYNNIDTVRKALQELLDKGYLYRDTDGSLTFVEGV